MNANFELSTQCIGNTRVARTLIAAECMTRKLVAIKLYNFITDTPRDAAREMMVLRRLDHTNITRFYNYYESSRETALVQELVQ